MTKRTWFLLLSMTTVLAGGLSGCNLAPDAQVPFMGVPAVYKDAPKLGDVQASTPETTAEVKTDKKPEAETPVVADAAANEGKWQVGSPAAAALDRGAWWEVFGDATLNELILQANIDNQNIAAMAARVKQARAMADAATASFFPSLDATGSGSRRKVNTAGFGLGAGGGKPFNFYEANLGLSYEVDLFGRVLNTSRAADAKMAGVEAEFASAQLAMQADVATLYFTLRALDAEKVLLEQALKLREDSVDILKKRLDAGLVGELDTTQATVELETTRSALQQVTQQRKETENAIAVLLGQNPSVFNIPASTQLDAIPSIPAGVPAELLQRRPDIAAAQADLIAANADIGIARAAFFPSISLTGTGGVLSTDLDNLFRWSNRAWSVGPVVNLPIFRGGAILAENDRARAAFEESVAKYKQSVLNAFRDVEDSLSRLQTLEAQAQAQSVSEAAAKRARDLAGVRYNEGDIGYLEDIVARQVALEVERGGLRLHGTRLAETVRLVRALGGAWSSPLPPPQPEAAAEEKPAKSAEIPERGRLND